jgi:hypothetical protein
MNMTQLLTRFRKLICLLRGHDYVRYKRIRTIGGNTGAVEVCDRCRKIHWRFIRRGPL